MASDTLTLTGTVANGDPLLFAVSVGPSHGTLSGFNPSTGAVTYTPTGDYSGPDSFMFTVTDTFDGLSNDTEWSKYGRGNDPRCEHCMVHCGYEPSAALGVNAKWSDPFKMLKWQLS